MGPTEQNAFSVRKHLQGDLQDFLQRCGFEQLTAVGFIRDVVCLLVAYREEDEALYPEVFIFGAARMVQTLAPGTVPVRIGTTKICDETARHVLKRCAGLAVQGWAVYIALCDSVEFGLFRAMRSSFATSAEESMKDLDGSPVVLVRNRGQFVVELMSAKSQVFTVSFTSALPAASKLAVNVFKLASAATSDIVSEKKAQFQPYFERLLVGLLQHCHGTLLAAHKELAEGGPIPTDLEDGVWLDPPIDLFSLHSVALECPNAEGLANLQAYEALIYGMVRNDGLIVLSTTAKILAYRVFLKANEGEKSRLPDKGGGRRRTYELMRSRLNDRLRAAFFRSQDGETECAEVPYAQ